jgi:hypothetical protein
MSLETILVTIFGTSFALMGVASAADTIFKGFSKRRHKGSPPEHPKWDEFFSIAAIGALVGLFASVSLLALTWVVEHAPAIVMSHWLSLVLVAVALILFALKKRALLFYGLIEVGAALGVIFSVSFLDQGSTAARLAGAATAAYFLIRGLDNVSVSPQGADWMARRGVLQPQV